MAGAAMPDWLMVLMGAALGNAAGIYAIIVGRRKIKAEADKIAADASKTVTDVAVGLLKPLQDRIDRLEAIIVRLEEKVAKLESANDELSRQVREFRALIRWLWEGALILTGQLQGNDILPDWDFTKYEELVATALGEDGPTRKHTVIRKA